MVKSFKIIPDREFFTPGSFVSGKVVVKVKTSTRRYDAIRLELAGRAWSHWWANHPAFSQNPHREHARRVEFYNKKVYLLRYLILWKREDAPNDELPAGEHTFPFEFLLPSDVPSSFEGELTGSIRYGLRAKIKDGSDTKHTTSILVPVHELVSLADGVMLTPMHYDSPEETVGSSTGQVSFSFDLPRRVYCTGETIPLSINIMNWSTRKIRLTAIFKRRVLFLERYIDEQLSDSEKKRLVVVSSSRIRPKRTVVWDTEISIPRDIPTSTEAWLGSNGSIRVTYVLKVRAKLCWSLRSRVTGVVVPIIVRGGAADPATEQQLLSNFDISPEALPVTVW